MNALVEKERNHWRKKMAFELFQLQPIHIYVGLAIFGLFSGIGGSVGQLVTKLWIEPHILKIHKKIDKIKKKVR